MLPQSTESPTEESFSPVAEWIHFGIDDQEASHALSQLKKRIAEREDFEQEAQPAVDVVQQLRIQMLGDPSEISDSDVEMLVRLRDYDILPRGYKIDWRIPVLGPIHSIVRRLINDEIVRFLFPSLKRQSSLNRQLVDAIQELAYENQQLRFEVTALQKKLITNPSKSSDNSN